jgi:5-carboxymethyl-2-hydroxymuconate isomerase
MLKSLDVILELTVVMLVASMAVTVLTQIYAGVRNLRGIQLRRGLVDLLRQIDPSISAAIATEVAGAVLSHPLVHESEKRMGTLVHRDEFTHLLMEIAAGRGSKALREETFNVLTRALAANGVADPDSTLRAIRDVALELEASHPEAAAHVRRDMAILQAAKCDLVAKINGWFDQTIDRVSERYTLTTRQVSLAAGLLVAVTLQLDTVALIQRLATGETKVHAGFSTWPGIALSALLLSLGAPFWFEVLKGVLRLRSAIAEKDDQQRAQRATADMPSAR